jgi:predicted Zn-dependent peptidase
MKILDDKKINEKVFAGRLSCQLPVYIVPKPHYKSMYAVLAIKYGSVNRNYFLNESYHEMPSGIAHFLEHKMFDMPDGTNTLNEFSLHGADCNAFTSKDLTAYYFDATENFSENLEILIKMVMTPFYTEESVNKERGIISQEIKMVEDNPSFIAYKNILTMLFGDCPVSEPIAGTQESISLITPELLYRCHENFYRPRNMALAIVGDLEPEKTFNLADLYLKKYYDDSASPTPVPDALVCNRAARTRKTTEYAAVSAPQLLFAISFTPQLVGKNYLKQKLTAEFTLQILFGPSSDFYAKNYCDNNIRSDFGIEVEYISNISFILLGGETKNPNILADFIIETLDSAKEQINSEKLERTKRAFIGSYIRSWEDFEEIALSFIEGEFYQYNPLDIYTISQSIEVADCLNFIYNDMSKNRAISILLPQKE